MIIFAQLNWNRVIRPRIMAGIDLMSIPNFVSIFSLLTYAKFELREYGFSKKKIFFRRTKTTTTKMSNTMVAVNMKIVLYVLKGAYSSSSGSTPRSCSSMKECM